MSAPSPSPRRWLTVGEATLAKMNAQKAEDSKNSQPQQPADSSSQTIATPTTPRAPSSEAQSATTTPEESGNLQSTTPKSGSVKQTRISDWFSRAATSATETATEAEAATVPSTQADINSTQESGEKVEAATATANSAVVDNETEPLQSGKPTEDNSAAPVSQIVTDRDDSILEPASRSPSQVQVSERPEVSTQNTDNMPFMEAYMPGPDTEPTIFDPELVAPPPQVTYAENLRDRLAPTARAAFERLEGEAAFTQAPIHNNGTVAPRDVLLDQTQVPFAPRPVTARAPGKWWPPIPTDSNADPFTPPIPMARSRVDPINFIADRPTMLHPDTVQPIQLPQYGPTNPRPNWMITDEERAELERGLKGMNQEALTAFPATQSVFDHIPNFPAMNDDDVLMAINVPTFNNDAFRLQSPVASPPPIAAPAPQARPIAVPVSIAAGIKRKASPTKKTRTPRNVKKEGDDESDDNFPVEVFVFDEANYDFTNSAPFKYIKNLMIPIAYGRKPADIIDFCINALSGEELLETEAGEGGVGGEEDEKKKKIVGNVALWEAYEQGMDEDDDANEEARLCWHAATIGLMASYHEKRDEAGLGAGFGAVGEYVDVKVLLWRREQAAKARKARQEKVPDKKDGEEVVEVEME